VCKLAKFCGRACQILHEIACKKQAAELYDEALFRQPPKGDDCPICFLLLPSMGSGQNFNACCGKTVCIGCNYEHNLQGSGSPSCPFCRAAKPTGKEYVKRLEKRADANDSVAISQLGSLYFIGDERLSITKDMDKGLKLLHRAAELGCTEVYSNLGAIYYKGDGVNKDKAKAKQYYEKGAMAGCTTSRLHLGIFEMEASSFDRAIKHLLIAASGGENAAVDVIKQLMAPGIATRDHYAQALRGYLSCLDEIRSPQRDRGAAWIRQINMTGWKARDSSDDYSSGSDGKSGRGSSSSGKSGKGSMS
jgi:hypothetical protein